jgi:diguanylate cyclase (GGDEF)-like protein/PAS domain S-box-containing protein
VKSLGTRLALILSTVLLALVLAAGLLIERQLTKIIYNQEIDQTKIHARTLLSSLQVMMLDGKGTLVRAWLDSMHGTAGIVDIEILRRDGTEAFTNLDTVREVNRFYDRADFEREPIPTHHMPFPSVDAFKMALAGKVATDLRFSEEITVLQPIIASTECSLCHGYDPNPLRGVLKLSVSRGQGTARVGTMRMSLLALAIFLVLVVALTLWIVLRINVLTPINRLRDAISQVGAGERHVSLPLHWRDELGQVARVFEGMQKDLLNTETRIHVVTENVFDAIITSDEEGKIDTINHAVEKMFGYSAAELIGHNVSVLMPDPYRQEHGGYIEKYLATGVGRLINSRGEVVGQRKDSSTFPMEIALSEMHIDEARYFIAVMRDITEAKEQTAALEYQALHDALTELPNRSLLSDRVRQGILLAQRDNQLFTLMIMDLDRFKDINDTLGHQYGDLVLQQVSKRMRDALRESDTIARLGGDEFAVFLPKTSLEQAKPIAEKLLKSIDDPFVVNDQVLHVGGSLGLTVYPQHGEDEVTLMQRADVAMYVAKRNHSGYAIYDPSTDQHSLRNLALLGELHSAIERDQLFLHYQPKVDLKTGRVFGVESLVRWQHPQHGLMMPDEFVPLAEQTGLIAPLSLWVLEEGMKQCQKNYENGKPVDLAVNLSVRNLHDSKFSGKVAGLIDDYCVDPRHLRLEITETAIMADPARALDVLNTLNAMGIRLSIDDFGTGYSSLAHLKQMPVDELKIDKSFVIGMMEDENDAVIVRSIIDLAHNIGIKVVAEGVETQEVFDALTELGCDAVQGYFMCAPVSAEVLTQWMGESPWGIR